MMNRTEFLDDFVDPAKSTVGIIDFKKPDDAIQLVGPRESNFIPETGFPTQWTFADGVLTASPKWDSVVTPEAYRDFRMHLEFNVNDAGDTPKQRNGNSGIYIQQRYEVQILNSFGVSRSQYKRTDCGSLYGLKTPDRLACRPAGEWQSFDIAFRAARFEGSKKTEPARITVYQNGQLIHDDVTIARKTGAGKQEENSDRPIQLQGHHNKVRFRNIWIQNLNLDSVKGDGAITQITASEKQLPLSGEPFKFNGQDAFVMMPRQWKKMESVPWVWYAPTLKGLPSAAEKWMFERFLSAGVAIAGIDVGESYGSPVGTKTYDEFYRYLTESRKFDSKPCLLARSRGGLMLYSWAASNPDSISGIAGIYPVCNLESYPGLDKACGAFGVSAQQLKRDLAAHNPIDRLESIAKAGVPIFHLHGDSDTIVPLEDNSAIVAKRYAKLGGSMSLEVANGQGHNMWAGWFESENLVEFVLTSLGRPLNAHPVPESDLWLTFKGSDGPGKGKHIVLIAADQEYRSEQSMPMLAGILSQHHGFDCTVLFSVNGKGDVDPTLPAPLKEDSDQEFHRIPGLEHLAKADCMILLSRFMQLPGDQLSHFHEYLDSGKPMIALRTANHGFWGDFGYRKDDKKVSLREILGGTFMGHHGGWHREATRGIVVPENSEHPILTGVSDVWGPSDVYRCHNDVHPFPDSCTSLMLGQPLLDLNRDALPNAGKTALPIAWIKSWTGNAGRASRIFHFTMGSAKDFENEGVRRFVANAVYWGLNMESSIVKDSSVEPIGQYNPMKSGFEYEKIGVRPRKAKFYRPKR